MTRGLRRTQSLPWMPWLHRMLFFDAIAALDAMTAPDATAASTQCRHVTRRHFDAACEATAALGAIAGIWGCACEARAVEEEVAATQRCARVRARAWGFVSASWHACGGPRACGVQRAACGVRACGVRARVGIGPSSQSFEQ